MATFWDCHQCELRNAKSRNRCQACFQYRWIPIKQPQYSYTYADGTAINKFTNVDKQTTYLVYGYVRCMIISDQIIPSEIVELCIKFYHSLLKILLIQSNDTPPPDFIMTKLSQIDEKNHCKYTVKPLDESYSLRSHELSVHSGICYAKNVKLPQEIFPMNDQLSDKYLHDVIFAIPSNETARAYILQQTDAFCWKLPTISGEISFPALTYSLKYGLIAIGIPEKQNSVNILKVDEQNEWRHHAMKRVRGYISISMISDDKIICCGGWNTAHSFHTNVDVYNLDTNAWQECRDMNEARCYAGISYDKYRNDRVYIGGGYTSGHDFEYLDMQKNAWLELPKTNGEHRFWPAIWTEDVNMVHIASPSGQVFEKMDIRENKWSVYIGGKSMNDIFDTNIGLYGDFRFCVQI